MVRSLVAAAKTRKLFKPLPRGAEKSDTLWLLELASDKAYRSAVAEVFRWRAEKRADCDGVLGSAIDTCKKSLPSVDWRNEGCKGDLRPVQPEEKDWQHRIVRAQKSNPYEFKPAVTDPVKPDRHPWHGLVDKPTFTEISAGIGVFAACFQAAGANCVCMVEPVPGSLRFAKKNCRDTSDKPFGLEDKEPGDFQWTHGIVGGPECQPFSSAGRQRGWEDDRSYTMIRTLHLAAVMKPWWVWLENVKAIESVAEGKVWQTIRGIAEELGYKVKLQQV